MRRLISLGLGAILLLMGAPPASAHSLKSLEDALHDKEKYFQPLDKEAPDFELQDAEGLTVRLLDYRGKVVVLHFIYTNCPDVYEHA